METVTSIVPKPIVLDAVEKDNCLTESMRGQIADFYYSLHGCSEETKANYVETAIRFGAFLKQIGKSRFEDANEADIGKIWLNST